VRTMRTMRIKWVRRMVGQQMGDEFRRIGFPRDRGNPTDKPTCIAAQLSTFHHHSSSGKGILLSEGLPPTLLRPVLAVSSHAVEKNLCHRCLAETPRPLESGLELQACHFAYQNMA
jgi:hypothetical protein